MGGEGVMPLGGVVGAMAGGRAGTPEAMRVDTSITPAPAIAAEARTSRRFNERPISGSDRNFELQGNFTTTLVIGVFEHARLCEVRFTH